MWDSNEHWYNAHHLGMKNSGQNAKNQKAVSNRHSVSLLTNALQSGGRLVSNGACKPSWKEHVDPNEHLMTVRKPANMVPPLQGDLTSRLGLGGLHFIV